MKSSDAVCEYTGKFYKRIFRKDDDSYCVCLYQDKGESTTVVGSHIPEVSYPVTFQGQWKTDPRYGKQFVVDMVVSSLPNEAKDIEQFIASLKVGIGQKRAAKMIAAVGVSGFWDELEKDPLQFCSISGIQEKAVLNLREKASEMTVQRDLLRFFAGDLSMDARQYKRICNYFRDSMDTMLAQIQDNPFILMNCGYGFKELDYFCSCHTCFTGGDERRLLAATQQALIDAKAQCHAGLPSQQLRQGISALLRKCGSVPDAMIDLFLEQATTTASIVYSNGLYYSSRSYEEECQIADALVRMANTRNSGIDPKKFNHLIAQYEKNKGFSLSTDQKNAVWTALTCGICVITGGPGTGKSTILDALLHCWKEFYDDHWLLMAPTGKAAVRITQTTEQGAYTIHSSLGLIVGNESMEKMDTQVFPIEQSLIVIDECSMLDQTVMASVTLALSGNAQHLVLVGDPDQLPSVGWGNVLADIISSGTIPVCKLGTIYRQGADNPIITNSKKMLEGDVNLDWSNRSFRRFNYGNDKDNMQAACEFYRRCVKQFGIENVMLLSPYHKATEICTNKLNALLQDTINPDVGQTHISAFGRTYRNGDRVIQLRNTESLCNGDVGTICWIRPNADEADPCLCVEFESGAKCEYIRESLVQLELAYALSVHKSQGSQSKVVITILPCEPSAKLKELLRLSLFYTAITRSEKNVAVFSPLQTIADCIRNNKRDLRHTGLTARLRAA